MRRQAEHSCNHSHFCKAVEHHGLLVSLSVWLCVIGNQKEDCTLHKLKYYCQLVSWTIYRFILSYHWTVSASVFCRISGKCPSSLSSAFCDVALTFIWIEHNHRLTENVCSFAKQVKGELQLMKQNPAVQQATELKWQLSGATAAIKALERQVFTWLLYALPDSFLSFLRWSEQDGQ